MAGIMITQELLESARLSTSNTDNNTLDKLSTGHQVVGGVGAISQDSFAISRNSERVAGLYDYLDDSRTKVDQKLQSGLRANMTEVQMEGYQEINENISQIESPILGIEQGQPLETNLKENEIAAKKIACINIGNCDGQVNPICRNRGGCDDGGNGLCSNRSECDDDDGGDNGRNGICGNRKGECGGSDNGICWNRRCRHDNQVTSVSIDELTKMRDRIDVVKTNLEQLVQNNPVHESDNYSRSGGLDTYRTNASVLNSGNNLSAFSSRATTNTTQIVDSNANSKTTPSIAENQLIQQTRDAGISGASTLSIASAEVTQTLKLLR